MLVSQSYFPQKQIGVFFFFFHFLSHSHVLAISLSSSPFPFIHIRFYRVPLFVAAECVSVCNLDFGGSSKILICLVSAKSDQKVVCKIVGSLASVAHSLSK